MTHRHFSRMHGRSTFNCDVCGRRTRDADKARDFCDYIWPPGDAS